MTHQVLFFGQLTDLTNTPSLSIEGVDDTHALVLRLESMFPGLAGANFAVAVNNAIVREHVPLTEPAIIALMPPFSGG
jgi:molybdopterin synthase sulfur carrier subunit